MLQIAYLLKKKINWANMELGKASKPESPGTRGALGSLATGGGAEAAEDPSLTVSWERAGLRRARAGAGGHRLGAAPRAPPGPARPPVLGTRAQLRLGSPTLAGAR